MSSFVAWRRPWLGGSAAVVALLAFAGVAVFHAPPVRAHVLALLISKRARTGIVAHADRLDYNLATFDVRLPGVTLATSTALETPFLTGDNAARPTTAGCASVPISRTSAVAAPSRFNSS